MACTGWEGRGEFSRYLVLTIISYCLETVAMAPPPPPAQAGKFKPRKPPPKKVSAGSSAVITPGISSSTNAAPATSSGATTASATREFTANSGSSSSGRGGSGNARGRGGRGRGGRMPIPQGRVFFTGIEAPQQQQQKASGPTKAGALGSSSSKSKEGEEIIVGEISGDGVGAAAIARAAAGDVGGFYDDDRWAGPYENEPASSATTLPPTAYTYISSSDDEQQEKKTKLPQSKNRHPANLPVSICPPNATGTTTTTTNKSTQVEEAEISPLDKLYQDQDPPMSSPFVEGNIGALSSPWILFKLPTRLPRIHPRCTISTTKQETDEPLRPDAVVSSSSIPDEATSQDEMMILEDDHTKAISNLSSVTSYDNTLKDISAGHYGKLLIYKSGKTVLVLGSPDQPTGDVRMLVMDGIHPSFQQQVVCIDPKEKSFIPLGEVQKTAVVIPDIDEAFVKS